MKHCARLSGKWALQFLRFPRLKINHLIKLMANQSSLRSKLNSYIKVYGEVSYNDLKNKVESGYFGPKYRVSNMERRLRGSESPDIEEIQQNGHIVAYRHKKPQQFQEAKITNPITGEVEGTVRLPI